jgi:hypothetical protein
MIAARAVPVAGQLVSVGGTRAVVTPLPGCVVTAVTEAFTVGVFTVVVGVVLVLLPVEPQAASRRTRKELHRKKRKR